MKVEFRRLTDPSEEALNKLGAQGFHFAGSGTTYEIHQGVRQPHFVVILQREVPEAPNGTLYPVEVENAIHDGLRDGFLTWVDMLSTSDAQKIFGSQS